MMEEEAEKGRAELSAMLERSSHAQRQSLDEAKISSAIARLKEELSTQEVRCFHDHNCSLRVEQVHSSEHGCGGTKNFKVELKFQSS